MDRTFSRPIFWPLVLIAAGVLWLLSSFGVISDLNLWVLLRFWPVLLIVAGLDVLFRQRWPWVSNLIAFLTVSAAVVVVLFAPQLGLATSGGNWLNSLPFMWGGAPGSGRVVTETRPVSNFDAVSFSSFGEVVIQQGEAEALVVEAEDNVLAEIRAEVRNGRLSIGYADENGWPHVRPTKPVRFTLTVKDLQDLDLSGAGDVTVQALTVDTLHVALSGAGSLACEALTVDSLNVRLSGAGSITASGTAKRLEARLSGVGSLKASDLQSGTADIAVSGVGSGSVWATESLEAHISGLGSVQYYGQPRVTEDVSGLGSLRRMGDK
jgi:hypothetical protein